MSRVVSRDPALREVRKEVMEVLVVAPCKMDVTGDKRGLYLCTMS